MDINKILEAGKEMANSDLVIAGNNGIKLRKTFSQDLAKILLNKSSQKQLTLGDFLEIAIDYNYEMWSTYEKKAPHIFNEVKKAFISHEVAKAVEIVQPDSFNFKEIYLLIYLETKKKYNKSKQDLALNNYESRFGKDKLDKIDKKISKAVDLKRKGNFVEAHDIYINLNNKYPNNPVILKSWAKVLVCLGKYEKAIDKYKKASKLYKELGSNEYWQCIDQINEIKNRHKNPEKFKSWVQAVSGGSITEPKLN